MTYLSQVKVSHVGLVTRGSRPDSMRSPKVVIHFSTGQNRLDPSGKSLAGHTSVRLDLRHKKQLVVTTDSGHL